MIKTIFNFKEIEHFKDILPIFATKEYLSFKSDKYGWFASDNFILPFYIKKKMIFNRLFFTTETIIIKNTGPSEEKLFLNNMILEAKKNKVDLIELPSSNAIFTNYPDKSFFTSFGTYQVDLNLNEDELFKNLHSKHRNVIRKAEKDNVIINSGSEYLRKCFEIIKNTYARQGKDFIDFKEFESLYTSLANHVSFYVALKDETIQGCAVLLWNENNSCYYLYGGSIENTYPGSMNFLHWKAMIDMKKNNVRYYDFMGARINPEPGSKLEGIQRFKERFGGTLKSGYIWKYPLNKFKYFLFQIMTRLYYISKFKKFDGDIIEQERKK